VMALLYTTRPSLRRLLAGRDGWIDFSVGILTESGSVRRTLRSQRGRVRASKGIREDVDVTLRFVDEAALVTMLRSTPNEVLQLILESRLVPEGNWAHLQLFNRLVGQLVGGYHQRRLEGVRRQDQRAREERYGGGAGNSGAAPRARRDVRLRGERRDPGVRHLEDPYLSRYGLEDFPRLQAFLEAHLTTRPEICAERPLHLTEWYRRHGFERDSGGPVGRDRGGEPRHLAGDARMPRGGRRLR